MRIIISGGGTGGHIYPAVAIAQKLKRQVEDATIIFVGTKQGLENEILKNYPFPLKHIEVSGFERKLSLGTINSFFKVFKGFKQALEIVKDFKPDIVIGTGGYVCGPVVLAAALSGTKTFIQEQNAIPGVTNKLLGKFVKKIFLGSEAAAKYFTNKNKLIFTGNPIREDITTALRTEGYEKLGLKADKITILVSGGSRGALSINSAMLYVDDVLANKENIQILHVTGDLGYKSIINELSIQAKNADNINMVPYMKEMPLALAVADLAVFRAGAIGLSELAARGVPSILVPYPYATANHQEHNARAFEEQNAAIVIKDKDLTGEKLYQTILSLIEDKEKLDMMAKQAKLLGRPNATEKIVENILKV